MHPVDSQAYQLLVEHADTHNDLIDAAVRAHAEATFSDHLDDVSRDRDVVIPALAESLDFWRSSGSDEAAIAADEEIAQMLVNYNRSLAQASDGSETARGEEAARVRSAEAGLRDRCQKRRDRVAKELADEHQRHLAKKKDEQAGSVTAGMAAGRMAHRARQKSAAKKTEQVDAHPKEAHPRITFKNLASSAVAAAEISRMEARATVAEQQNEVSVEQCVGAVCWRSTRAAHAPRHPCHFLVGPRRSPGGP